MIGICRKTGKALSGWALFVSHATDVLTTQLGEREKRRNYGCRLPELKGKNAGPNAAMLARAYTAQAFANPENGLSRYFKLERINIITHGSGFTVQVSGEYQGKKTTLEV